MIDLDDLAALSKIDSEGFLSHLESFPEQATLGWQLGNEYEPLPQGWDLNSVAVLGMGGSGISGDVLRAILAPQSPVSVGSIKGYDLPEWVGHDTLVFAASYSGSTEETLHALELARTKGARIIPVTSGGRLEEGSGVREAAVLIPPGLPPRAALGYLTFPMLAICQRLGLCDIESHVDETLRLLRGRRDEYRRETATDNNRAKQLAQDLIGKLPVIYGSEGIAHVAAYRWKCQFNECSKVPAYHNFFPELDHNEIEGWTGALDLESSVHLIALRHEGDQGHRGARIDLTLSMLEDRVGSTTQISGAGDSDLARLLDLIYLGDFTSAYLGLAGGQDPGRLRAIPALKAQMDQSTVS